MQYPRNSFVKSDFIDVPDPNNPPVGAREVNAQEINKIGTAIEQNREGLHLSTYILNGDELNAHAPIDSYPLSSEIVMWSTHTSWPGVGGIVKTYRPRGSTLNDDLISYDYQTFKLHNSKKESQRYALTRSKTDWAPNTNYVTGQIVQPIIDNGCYYRCTVGGLSKATEPVWPTADGASVTETDVGGANPTVTWTKDGEFWSKWDDYAMTKNPNFTGLIKGENLTISGNFVSTPSATQDITVAGTAITANSREKKVSNTTAGVITLNAAPTIADGFPGQEIIIKNVGTQNIVLQDQGTLAASNLRLSNPTVTLRPLTSIYLVFVDGINDWVQVGQAGLLTTNNPAYTGTLSGVNLTTSGNHVNTPSSVQGIGAATDAITVISRKKLVSNTTVGSLTLNSVPTIADGTNGTEVIITNTGTQNIVLQDQGTLAGSNLRLQAATVTLGPLDSIELTFLSSVGDWVQTSPLVVTV